MKLIIRRIRALKTSVSICEVDCCWKLTKKQSCGVSSDSHIGEGIAVMSSNLHFQKVDCGSDFGSSLGISEHRSCDVNCTLHDRVDNFEEASLSRDDACAPRLNDVPQRSLVHARLNIIMKDCLTLFTRAAECIPIHTYGCADQERRVQRSLQGHVIGLFVSLFIYNREAR
jgi:hypothetical protein